ncbi:MAG: DUF4416 family protein [Synergistales bacterium]|nr:DUF4416 family protein [Synergistales bacterium]
MIPVKLFVATLTPSEPWWQWALERMRERWGPPEQISEAYSFQWTRYYDAIGTELTRRLLSFQGLWDGEQLAQWKTTAVAIEEESGATQRRVNIDPGFIDGARLILASTKDRAQRIPIGNGLFAEVTLRYRSGKWAPFDYTFPDFASGIYAPFLSEIRARWVRKHRQNGGHAP